MPDEVEPDCPGAETAIGVMQGVFYKSDPVTEFAHGWMDVHGVVWNTGHQEHERTARWIREAMFGDSGLSPDNQKGGMEAVRRLMEDACLLRWDSQPAGSQFGRLRGIGQGEVDIQARSPLSSAQRREIGRIAEDLDASVYFDCVDATGPTAVTQPFRGDTPIARRRALREFVECSDDPTKRFVSAAEEMMRRG